MLDQLGGEIVSFNYKSANLGSSPTGVIDLKGLSPNACIAVVFYPMRKFTTGNQTSIILWKNDDANRSYKIGEVQIDNNLLK